VVGAVVDSVFKIVASEIRPSKRGQPFLWLSLADRTGRIQAKRWEMSDEEIEDIRHLRYIRVQGIVDDYKGSRQIVIEQPLEDCSEDCDPVDYEQVAALSLTELRRRLD